MIEFKSVNPTDRAVFESFYDCKEIRNAESSFANLCAYSFIYHGEYAIVKNCLVTRIHFDYGKRISYHYPIGRGCQEEVLEALIEDAKLKNYEMSLLCHPSDIAEDLKPRFEFAPQRDFFDYLYLRSDLENLKGRKYQPKRNHINKFKALYDWEFKILGSQDKVECMKLEREWIANSVLKNPNLEQDYRNEEKIVEYLFEHFDELGIFAGAIKVDGNIVAFSLGSSINRDTFDVHIEKANRDFEGAFAIINQQMAEHLPQNFVYINREEDLGIEGLRKAKQSYYPFQLIEKYIATLCR